MFIEILNQYIAENNELNCTESEFQSAKQEIGFLLLILHQIKQNHEHWRFSEKSLQKQPQKRLAPSDPTLMKSSVQIQVVRRTASQEAKMEQNIQNIHYS
jgi:hypothetical protein